MLLVMPMILVMAMCVLFGATVRLHAIPVYEPDSSLGIIHSLEIVTVITVDDVPLWHHLQVGSDAVVAGTCMVAKVDNTAFVDALIR